jgi:hypothetical protein
MKYSYTANNRLHEPHAYMYSPYGGEAFLQSYVADRLERLLLLNASTGSDWTAAEAQAHTVLRRLLNADGDFPVSRLAELMSVPNLAAEFESKIVFPVNFPNIEPIKTGDLLCALLNSFLDFSPESDVGTTALHWLDRLLQRFEVSKKLRASYLPGFRKGEGVDDDVGLYRQFALVLALAYAHQQELQYLSTLLKVNDLLLSLPVEAHAGCSDDHALFLTIAVELHAVLRLAEKQGVSLSVD